MSLAKRIDKIADKIIDKFVDKELGPKGDKK